MISDGIQLNDNSGGELAIPMHKLLVSLKAVYVFAVYASHVPTQQVHVLFNNL